MMKEFPRLLVATECSPNSAGGGAAVIRQMLKDWPTERLSWWSCHAENGKLFGQEVAAHRVAQIPRKLYPNHRWCKTRSWLLEKFWMPWAANHFRRTLQELKPDLVWVIPHVWSITPIFKALPESGIGFHVTLQDYADVEGNVVRLGKSRCHRLVAQANALYAAAGNRDATSHPMIAELLASTQASASQMLHAGLEENDFALLPIEESGPGDKIRIAYAGTILVENEFAFFVRVLKRIRPQLSKSLALDFFGDHSYQDRDWFDPAWMQEHGNLPTEKLFQALRKCTWGFAPMGLSDANARYNRFSFPTKFISYLAAGLPAITIGHPESSVIKMASQYDVGLCSTSTDVETLSRQLLEGLSQPKPKERYRHEILRCASTEFDAKRMRAKLYDDFRKCAAAGRL